MRGMFSDELTKGEKQTTVKQVSVTPGPKAMAGLFDPETVEEQKKFDGRITSEPITPDTKVRFFIFSGSFFFNFFYLVTKRYVRIV